MVVLITNKLNKTSLIEKRNTKKCRANLSEKGDDDFITVTNVTRFHILY